MRLGALSLSLALALLLPSPAYAHHDPYWGDSARAVAKHIGCKKFHGQQRGEAYNYTGICRLKGKRVSVITFHGSRQQRAWNAGARAFFGPNFYWADGPGAIVVAENGNRPAARIGVRRLPGNLKHG